MIRADKLTTHKGYLVTKANTRNRKSFLKIFSIQTKNYENRINRMYVEKMNYYSDTFSKHRFIFRNRFGKPSY